MSLFKRKKRLNDPIGYLVFDAAYPGSPPYLALDQASDLDTISESKYVTLKVIRANGGSQK